MKSLPAKRLIQILTTHGFIETRRKGSHIIFVNKKGVMVPVPLHGKNKQLPIGTFLAIVIPSPINHFTHIPEFWLRNFVSRSPYLDMARAPSRFSLKIQKRVFVKALMRDGIKQSKIPKENFK